MSYVNKGPKLFENPKPPMRRVRSEFRMKRYNSADDLRTWCDDVEQRRQQILEYQAKDRGASGPCPDKLIPLEALLNIVVSMKNNEIKELEVEVKRLEELVKKTYELKLTPEQRKEFDKLKAELDSDYVTTDDDETTDI